MFCTSAKWWWKSKNTLCSFFLCCASKLHLKRICHVQIYFVESMWSLLVSSRVLSHLFRTVWNVTELCIFMQEGELSQRPHFHAPRRELAIEMHFTVIKDLWKNWSCRSQKYQKYIQVVKEPWKCYSRTSCLELFWHRVGYVTTV